MSSRRTAGAKASRPERAGQAVEATSRFLLFAKQRDTAYDAVTSREKRSGTEGS